MEGLMANAEMMLSMDEDLQVLDLPRREPDSLVVLYAARDAGEAQQRFGRACATVHPICTHPDRSPGVTILVQGILCPSSAAAPPDAGRFAHPPPLPSRCRSFCSCRALAVELGV